ncbi:MAG: tRNA (N6-threonylcarbamoyladenosine(37)-N6)-methyltransferase TrmO [Coprococcus sp.]
MEIIGYIHTDYKEKFGIPRQSGLVEENSSYIEFEPKYRQVEAFRGLAEFSHIWVLWQFSKACHKNWTATVKPPKLGGNKRMGVFATRSPFRPNNIGLSSVKLVNIEYTDNRGPILHISGADMLDKTPVYDIKPYLPYTDCHPYATGGWTEHTHINKLHIDCPDELLSLIPDDKRQAVLDMLAADPRPGYQDDPDRRYGIAYSGYDIRFKISGDVLQVVDIIPVADSQ